MKRQVFVNVWPLVMTVLSGMVTSAIMAALSLHAPVEDVDAVPSAGGVVVVAASGVELGGVAVGSDSPDFVGGRVEVTKRGGASVAACCSTLMHEDNVRTVISPMIQIFFM